MSQCDKRQEPASARRVTVPRRPRSLPEVAPKSRRSRAGAALHQQTSKNLGFDPVEVDGFPGPNTVAAGLEEISANSPNTMFGVESLPDDSAILEPAIVRLGISCSTPAPPLLSSSDPVTAQLQIIIN